MKSPEMSPPINDPITNQYSNRIITQRDPILPPLLSTGHTEHKPFSNDTNFQIKQKTDIIVLQIIHILRTKIL